MKAPRTILVVIFTSSDEGHDVIESYNLGVNSYVLKPRDFDDFIDAVIKVGMYWIFTNQLVFY